ncbi:MAG TPA: 3-deoxy-manno-octulosonate cytidylyltransferase [Flavobacteriia bacterium]|jgi:3-deoxy-manno-octulosonate cytidylyltransferase (CMP-KDO synthetase)|nr:3-deoxy-manno-octulosonate cytidylyltransferase [Flavobacteriia bacterium]
MKKEKRVLGIIPARYGSTRLEGKPLVDICGKPMIQRVYEKAKQANIDIVVATDDKRIYDVVKFFGGNVVMTSKNHQTGTNRCLEAFNLINDKCSSAYDVIINIQGDEPLLESNQINELLTCFDDPKTEMATLVMPVKDKTELKSGVFVVKDINDYALYFSRAVIPFVRDVHKESWTDVSTFYKHVGMYAFTPKALQEFANLAETKLENAEKLEQLRWLENGKKIKLANTKYNSVAVDTLEDVEKVKNIISKTTKK